MGDSGCLVKKTGAGSGESGALTGDGNILAWKARANHVCGRQVVLADGVHVIELSSSREVGSQQLPARRVSFHHGHGLHTGTFKTEIKTTDTSEQGNYFHVNPSRATGSIGRLIMALGEPPGWVVGWLTQ